jgi:hypothetical protein
MSECGKMVALCAFRWSLFLFSVAYIAVSSTTNSLSQTLLKLYSCFRVLNGRSIYRALRPWLADQAETMQGCKSGVINPLKPRGYFCVPPGLTFTNSAFCPHSVFMCFVWISEKTAIIFLYSINWLVFIIQTECVYWAVRANSLNKTDYISSLKG